MPDAPLRELGWQGDKQHDDLDVAALRTTLQVRVRPRTAHRMRASAVPILLARQAEAGIEDVGRNVVHPSEPDVCGHSMSPALAAYRWPMCSR
jgi:hypothetical protein